MDAAGDLGNKRSAVAAESYPEGGDGLPTSEKGVRTRSSDSPPAEGSVLPEQLDDASLNPQLLDQLNEQFAKQVQLAVNEGMDDAFKIAIYNDWVHSLRSLNTELVQSLREMQDTCMERMALMRAAYLKDLVRFGPDIRLKRLDSMSAALSSVTPAPGEEIVALELSSNYPIVPTTDQMLLQELDGRSRQIEQLRQELSDRCSLVDQLRNMTQEREKQLDDKRKEIDILRQQISSLDGQLLKAKLSAAATTDNRSLISEITDHHDKITQLKKKLKEQEDKLRQANTAIHFRDEVIAQQRHEIKLLHEDVTPHSVADVDALKQPERVHFATPESKAMSSSSFLSIVSDGSVSNFTGSTLPLLDGIETIQKHSETETEYVRTLQQELTELRAQLHDKRVHGSLHRSTDLTVLNGGEWDRADVGKALLGLRGACEELLQTTARVCGAGEALGGCHEESGTLRYEDDDELIEAMRACGEMLCRRLAEHPAACALEQDEGIGSATVSRLEDCSDVAAQRELHAEAVVCQVVEQLKRLLGKDSNNSASQSLSSLSLGLDEGCTLQGLIDDLKKEIESKDLVLRDRHAELERLHQELASRERQLDQCRARQETIDGEKMTLQKKIAGLEETADDQGRIIAMLNMEKSKLMQQVEDLKETLQQYRDNLQQTSEEKVAIEDECKNQLVTISNLRVALEETKRNGSSSVNVLHELVENLQLEVMLLSEQLNDAFKENLTKDNELDHYRDSNLQLRCQLAELSREFADLKDLSQAVDIRQELNEQKQRVFALLKDDVKQLQDQMNGVRGEIVSRQQDLGHLNFFREKCAEMERLHELEMSQQRSKHSNELKQLRREIESLSNQLVSSSDTSKQHDQTVEALATLQATILKLDEHNRVLQKTIQAYQDSIVQLEQQVGGSQHQLSTARQELEELRSRCDVQEGKIVSLKSEKDRIAGELVVQRRMCKCGFNSSPGSRERAKTPLSHSLQKQLAQKTLEATRAQEELAQRIEEWKKRETEYVNHRIQATEQTTDLIEQLSELKGRNSNLEQSGYMKDELIERLQHSLRDVNRKLATKQDQVAEVETKNNNLSDALERARQDALACEKRCMEELSNVRRCSMDQKNQLQQYERQINRLRAEVDAVRDKSEKISSERDALRDESQGLRERMATFEGKQSALCEVVKSNQDELANRSSRVLELEETNRKLNQNYQHLNHMHEELSKQFRCGQQEIEQLKDSSKKLLEFKQQTLATKELMRKSVAEWKERETQLSQEIVRLKKRTEMLDQDRAKLIVKLREYHRDNMILSRPVHQQQSQQQQPSRQHSPYDDNRRSNNLTPLHQTFYPPEAYKLVRSSSDPNCNESDELLQKVEFTCNQLQQIRKFWHQGLKEVFPSDS